MVRYISCLAVALLATIAARACELDADFKPAAPAAPEVQQKAFLPVNALARAALSADNADRAPKESELDSEVPGQSWRGWGGGWRGGWGGGWRGGWGGGWRGGWGGWRGGWGWGGRSWGWGGWGRGWGGWGGYGLGWGGYPYYGYSAYYPTYFSSGFYGYPGWGYCW